MIKTKWNIEAAKAYETGQGVELVNEPYPHYIPKTPKKLESNSKEWVGLTDEEIKEFDTWHDNREEEIGWVNPSEIVAYIEAKLKEKNR